MKYYAEITQNNQPKNMAEKAARELVFSFDQTLAFSQAVKDRAINDIRHEVNRINQIHRRCGDVNVNQWVDPIHNNINIAVGGCTTLTFKIVKEELP